MPPTGPISRARFAASVREALRNRRMTQAALAETVGVTPATVSDWVNQKKTPTDDSAERVLNALGLSWSDVIATGHKPATANGTHTRTEADTTDPASGGSAVVLVPHDGHAAAASSTAEGRVSESTAEPDQDPYPRHVLQQVTGLADPSPLRSFTVVGDSLADEISPNARLLYLPLHEYAGDGLYIVEIDGAMIVKQLQRLGGGTLEFIPRNSLYERERFTPVKDADTENTYRSTTTALTSRIRIVGKVVFYPKAA